MRENEKYKLPVPVYQQCLWIVRGYDRCRSEYQRTRSSIIEACNSTLNETGVRQTSDGRGVENVAARLEALENHPVFRQMKAVDASLNDVVEDFPLTMREQIRAALLLSFQDGKQFPYERLYTPGMSKSTFYRLRRHVLYNVALELNLLFPERS